jgi:hypothetical protein
VLGKCQSGGVSSKLFALSEDRGFGFTEFGNMNLSYSETKGLVLTSDFGKSHLKLSSVRLAIIGRLN